MHRHWQIISRPSRRGLTNRTKPTVTRWAGSRVRVKWNYKGTLAEYSQDPIGYRGHRGIRLYRGTAAASTECAGIRRGRNRATRNGVGRGVAFPDGDHSEAGGNGAAWRYFSGGIWGRGAGLRGVCADD